MSISVTDVFASWAVVKSVAVWSLVKEGGEGILAGPGIGGS